KRWPFLGLAAACVIVALFGWGIYYSRAAQLERQVSGRLEQKIDLMRRVEVQMNQVRKETAALDAVATPLLSAVSERTFWTELLEDLNTRLPKEDIWITELAGTSAGRPLTIGASRPGTSELSASPTPINGRSAAIERTLDGLLVRGLYMFNPRQQEVAVDYFRNLTNSPFFAIDPNNQAKALKPTTPTSSEWAFPYELHLDLKKPVKLP
ncbi:MAG: PilN domain-containing protein, partial [Chthoniobacterales bacterium]